MSLAIQSNWEKIVQSSRSQIGALPNSARLISLFFKNASEVNKNVSLLTKLILIITRNDLDEFTLNRVEKLFANVISINGNKSAFLKYQVSQDISQLGPKELDHHTLLTFACTYCDLDTIKQIVKGLDLHQINKPNKQGGTALMLACRNNRLDVVQFLLSLGAQDIPNSNGLTALHVACERGCLDAVKALLTKENTNLKTKNGMTPLIFACRNNRAEVASFLLDQGADKDITDSKGWPALHYACEKEYLQVVQALVKSDNLDLPEIVTLMVFTNLKTSQKVKDTPDSDGTTLLHQDCKKEAASNVSEDSEVQDEARISRPQTSATPTPIFSGDVMIATRITGYIGRDKQYQFGKTIRLESGESLPVSPKDFYCSVSIKKEGSKDPHYTELPSSLFHAMRVENVLRFYWGGVFCKLNLAPTPVRSRNSRKKKDYLLPFNEGLKCVEKNLRFSQAEFLHQSDIPRTYAAWDSRRLVILSPESKRIELGKVGATPLDFKSLHRIPSDLPSIEANAIQILKENKPSAYRFLLSACGLPEIDIVLDRNHLYVHTKAKKIEPREGGRIEYETIEKERFFHTFFEDTENQIDETRVTAQLDDSGLLRIDLPLLSLKPNAEVPQGS